MLVEGEEEVGTVAVGKSADFLVLDSADVELPGISPTTRALVSPVVLAALLERVSAHLEVLRDHYASRMRGANELRTRMLRVWQGDETDQTTVVLLQKSTL